jgi:tetratricopeptide (TPR) repeat protein
MYGLILVLAALPALAAGDPVQLALVARAQSDFDRVQLSAAPALVDTAACLQSQAAVLAVTAPESVPLIRFRQGFCALTSALLTKDRKSFTDAAQAFEQSIAARELRPRDNRKAPPEPETSAVASLAAISRLLAGAPASDFKALDGRLDLARKTASCPATVMPVALCREILAMSAQWQGWIAVRQNQLLDAATFFAPVPSSGWRHWVAGREAFRRRDYREAADAYGRAVETWTQGEKNRTVRIPQALEPQADLASALSDLGGAQIAAGDAHLAVATLDRALRRDPDRPWAFFLRGRARELSGDAGGALADYNLAARTALASSSEQSTGEGRFYRGVWTLRRGDAEGAEAEFSEALNAGPPPNLAADVAAWRALAAVTAGACGASRDKLESAAAAASPFFPRPEARTVMASCGASPTRISEAR